MRRLERELKRRPLLQTSSPARQGGSRLNQMARVSRKTVSLCGFTPIGEEQGSYDTNHDTNGNEREEIPAELIERNGRPEWIRTIDLFRVKEAL